MQIQFGGRYTWDRAKAFTNLKRHGVSFQSVQQFEWQSAVVFADVRSGYPEPRLIALAPVGGRLHVLVYSVDRRSVRVISFRKANSKEFDRYERQSGAAYPGGGR